MSASNTSNEGPTRPDKWEGDLDAFPASFGQQRLWFLNQLDPYSSFYHIPLVARLKGAVDAAVLSRAINALVDRHEALRTTFAGHEDQLLQVISPPVELTLTLIDISEIAPDDERARMVDRLVKTEGEQPFDLAQGPLLRIALVRLNDDEHLLLVTMHHIASDGWSVKIFFAELAVLYNSYLAGVPAPLPELTIQYADCSEWQRELLQGEFLDEQLAYWRRQLLGVPALLQLPTDRPRPPAQMFHGGRCSLALPAELSEKLTKLSRQSGVTLFITLLAAFQTLLYRYSGSEDVVVGTPSANRRRSEMEKVIGPFVNTLVLRLDLSGNPPFRELLRRAREVAVEAYAHQDLPFDKLVDALNPERSLSYSALVQVIFALEAESDLDILLAGLDVSWLEVDRGTSKFDLALFVTETTAGLLTTLEYDTDLFNAETMGRMLDHFQILLEGIVSNPDQRVGELPLLTAAELVYLTGGPRSLNNDSSGVPLHLLFARQAQRTPDRVAVTFQNEQLTYRELNTRANQLAHYLQKRGVGPEVLVGLCLDRSLELIIGLLAILKAGGAYLPLDPASPPERLAFMLSDADAKILIASEQLIERLPAHKAISFCVDREWDRITGESEAHPKANSTVDNLAYVIYTSGSTGKPKGVDVTHRNVVRLFEVTGADLDLTEADVWTLFHSAAFDFSVWEIWGALLSGGRLVIVPYWLSRSPEEFWELLCRERVTVLNQTPSAFRQLMTAATAAGKENLALRLVIFGGEALDLQSLKPWFAVYGDRSPQLVNMYGITETTVHVTRRPLQALDREENTGSLIGRPLDDLHIYLLDRFQQLVPIGVPGEIYVGGAGVTRGYRQLPELTAERFGPDGFARIPGARLYRSGDRARFLPSGDLEYLGRLDRQIKVRGFRIELAEIETVLTQSAEVRQVLVLPLTDAHGQTTLVAYAVPNSTNSLDLQELRSFAKAQLPDYMVPSFFVSLESLPLTASGKVDERSLPAPHQSGLVDELTLPRNAIEARLARIWSGLLGREEIDVHDNFFELGGHSLLATQLVTRVRDTFQVRLSLRSVFERPTVAALAELITEAPQDSPSSSSLPIKRLVRD